jgi:hypothetical protein
MAQLTEQQIEQAAKAFVKACNAEFLAPEPEVPDAILALICREDETPPCRKVYNERILEAYRRGQKAGK